MKRMIYVALATALFSLAPFSSVWSGWVRSSTPSIPTGQGLNGVKNLYFINPDTGWAVGFQRSFFKTSDGGRTWQKQPNPSLTGSQLFGVYFLNSQEGWIVGGGQYFPGPGLIAHTTDGGVTWEEQVNPHQDNTLFYITKVGDEIWTVGWTDESSFRDHGLLLRSRDHGRTWSGIGFPDQGGLFYIEVIAPNNVWLTGTQTVLQTTDGGQTWYDRSEGLKNSLAYFNQIVFIDSQVGYLVGNRTDEWGGKFYATTDGGKSWLLRKVWGDEMQAEGMAVVGQTIYVAGGDITNGQYDVASILASKDGGITWAEVARGTTQYSTFHSRIFRLASTHMWVAWREFWYYVPNQTPHFSITLGTSQLSIAEQWQYIPKATDADGDSLTFSLLEAPGFLHIDSVTGIIWGTPATGDQGEHKVVVQVSDGNGGTDTMTFLLQVGQPTAVELEEALGLPTKFVLHQNYPNPFNPATTIEYSLPTSADVRLSIYNLVGQELIVLVSEHQPIGFYSVKFTAANLPSGPYLVRLTAGGAAQTRKMLLLK